MMLAFYPQTSMHSVFQDSKKLAVAEAVISIQIKNLEDGIQNVI